MMTFKKKDRLRFPAPPRSTRDKGRCLVFGMLLAGLAAVLTVFPPASLRYMEGRLYDVMLQSLPAGRVHPLPVIVAIDDSSLEGYGQWPWPRSRLAGLLQKIHDLGAAGIGLDLILAEPDRCSVAGILDELERETGRCLAAVLADLPDSDRTLARTMAGIPVAMGYKLLFHSAEKESRAQWLRPLRNAVLQDTPDYPEHLLRADGVLCNLPLFSQSAPASGFINAGSDPDGVLRRVPLLAQYRGGLYPGLALACLLMGHGDPKVAVVSGPDGLMLHWNGRQVPLDAYGNLLLRYRGRRGTFPVYSAGDILSGRISGQALKDRIVIVGTLASGLGDWHVTPFDNRYPGPEVHATVMDNLMGTSFLYRPGWADGAELLSVIVLGTMLALTMAYGSSAAGLAVAGLGVACTAYISRWLLQAWGMYLSPLMPLAVLFIVFSGLSFLNYDYAERKARRRTLALQQAQDAAIIRLAALTETRDLETGRHLQRTQRYVQALAHELSRHPRYGPELDAAGIDFLSKCAPLHDIGKVGIPDHILLKKGQLTTAEFDVVKEHPLIGARVLSETVDGPTGEGSGYFDLARDIAVSHHEKWDGTGYPFGLKGTDIPLAGRIMALADVYDALTTQRTYKPAFGHEKSREIIIGEKERHFDPDVVEAFLLAEDTFRAIAEELR